MTHDSQIRSFIALDLPPKLLKTLERAILDLQRQTAGLPLRWTPAKNIHITLKFLGDVPVSQLDALKRALQDAGAGSAPFSIEVGGLGAFPNRHKPRVVWVGVQAPDELAALQRRVDQAAAQLGFPSEERPFSPHLTVGRISNRAGSQEVRRIGEVLVNYPLGKLGAAELNALHLYRSELTPAGPIYTRLYSGALYSGALYSGA